MNTPFDLKTALLARNAQHVVVIHFPIALFISAMAFDLFAHWTKSRDVAQGAYFNFLAAALSTIPALGTGILAWQFQLEGQKVKGILLMHLILACVSTVFVWLSLYVYRRTRRPQATAPRWRFLMELVGVIVVALTGHLGGFLSGVNGPN